MQEKYDNGMHNSISCGHSWSLVASQLHSVCLRRCTPLKKALVLTLIPFHCLTH